MREYASEQARPTPQTTIEAIMYGVRGRGLGALHEPSCQLRLSMCDAAARSQINDRIGKLVADGRLPEENCDA